MSATAEKAAPTPKPKAKPVPKRRRGPSPLAVITSGLGLFFVVLTLLAIQVRSGHDPSLGPGLTPPAISQPGAKGASASTPAQEAGAIVSRTSPAPPP